MVDAVLLDFVIPADNKGYPYPAFFERTFTITQWVLISNFKSPDTRTFKSTNPSIIGIKYNMICAELITRLICLDIGVHFT